MSLVFSLIFIPLWQDAVNDFFVNTFGGRWFRRSDSLTGEWLQDWQVDGREKFEHLNPKLELKQLGKSLVGTFYFEDRTYRIRAKIENNAFISGIWFDEVSGQVYHGAFQAKIEVNQKKINGKWIGFSSTHSIINTGSWQWERKPGARKDKSWWKSIMSID